MSNLFSIRSLLFTPAHKPSLFAKSITCGADMLVIDLEDSLPIEFKNTIYDELIKNQDLGIKYNYGCRINTIRSSFGLRDILFLQQVQIPPELVILPNIESALEVEILKSLLPHIKLVSTIETPEGVLHASEIASVSDGLIFGAADYSAKFGVIPTFENLYYPRNIISLAAASAGIPAFDTACFRLNDIKTLEEECVFVKKLGFFGKAAIHPFQVEMINNILSLKIAEQKWANSIITRLSNSNIVTSHDDSMIGPPFLEIAKTMLKRNSNGVL